MNRFLALPNMRLPVSYVAAALSGCWWQVTTTTAFTATPSSRVGWISSGGTKPVSLRTLATVAETNNRPFPTWSFDEPCTTMAWSDLVPATLTMGNVADQADLLIIGVMAPPKKDDKVEEEDNDESDDETEAVTLTGIAKEMDEKMGGALTDFLRENSKKFKNGATVGGTTPTLRGVGTSFKKIILLGLGAEAKDKNWTGAGTSLGKAVANACNSEPKVGSCQVILPPTVTANSTTVMDFSAAFYQTLYADNRFRTGKKVKKPAEDLKTVTIVTEGEAEPVNSSVLERGQMLARGIFITKDIVNAPHNIMNSLTLANTARKIAEESGGSLTCTVLDKDACEERGMGAYLGVARGSETPPQFIHLTYKAEGENNRKVGVVGKGLLFDTGGYNIKTQMMEMMKFDCGGAAAVLGAARAIGALKPPGVEAHFVVAACENMISGKAVVPSDILTASNGKTIEVMNTDAEGRLTLADALVYVDKEIGCEKIIELSTLTGACMISLGKEIAGLWTSSDELAKELDEVSKATGDKTWRMPLAKEYNEQIESKFADMKNVGTRYGGAITAALFLQNFVNSKKPFAHIDIAGPVWSDKDGATGFGAKLVVEWITRQGAPSS